MVTIQLGRYSTKRLLEDAGPVKVYLADREGTEVALYYTEDRNLGLDPGSFLRGADALKRLPPNLPVARVLDSGADPSMFWLATEHHPGRTWAEMCTGSKASPGPLTMAGLVLEIAEHLVEAHASGLVHGGLCPQSVVLSRDGVTMLTRFGLSSLFGAPVALEPRYRAPEHLRAPLNLDARSDVYGLGLTLYHLLTLEPPYRDHRPSSLPACALSEPLDLSRTDIPTCLREVLVRATAKDPTGRYADVAELRGALLEASRSLAATTLAGISLWPDSGVRSADKATLPKTPSTQTLRSDELIILSRSPGSDEAARKSLLGPPTEPEGAPPAEVRPAQGQASPAVAPAPAPPSNATNVQPAAPPGEAGTDSPPPPADPSRLSRASSRAVPPFSPPVWVALGFGLAFLGALAHNATRPPWVPYETPAPASPAPPPAPLPLPPAPESRSTPQPQQPQHSPDSAPRTSSHPVLVAGRPVSPSRPVPAPPSTPAATSAPSASGPTKRFPWEVSDPCALSWYRCPK